MVNNSSGVYRKSFEVRWDDVDPNGHLRSTGYLDYTVNSRLAFLDAAGWGARTLMQNGLTTVLLEDHVQYLREVFLAQRVHVTCELVGQSPDASLWKCRHIVEAEDGTLAAIIYSHGAWFDLASRKIVVPPEALTEALRAMRSSDWAPMDVPRRST